MSDQLQQTVDEARGVMLRSPTSTDPNSLITAVPNYWEAREERRKREAEATTGTYWEAISRQDSPVAGVVGWAVGQQYTPDPNFTPFKPEVWKELTQGLPPEYHQHLAGAVSYQHGLFLNGQIHEKLQQLQTLGDLEGAGTAARIGFGLVEPTNLSLGILSGGAVSLALQGKKLMAAGKALQAARATGTAEAASIAAKGVSEAAAVQAGKAGVAAGIGTGALAGAGWEALRQQVSFEDDKHLLLYSALLGAGFSTPFAFLSARNMSKLSKAAAQERDVIETIVKAKQGHPLSPKEESVVTHYLDRLKELEKRHTEMGLDWEAQQAGRAWDDAFATGEAETVRGTRLGRERAQELRAALAEKTKDFETRFAGDYQRLAAKSEAEAAALLEKVNAKAGTQPTNMELAFMRAQVQQKLQRAKEFDAARAQVEATKAKQMDEVWAEGHMAKQPDPLATPDSVPEPTPAAPKPIAVEENVAGKEVMWEDEYGDLVFGTIDNVAPDGRLVVTTLGDEAEMVVKSRSELHPESALYESAVPEGFLPGSVGAAQVGAVPKSQVSPDVDELTSMSRYRWDMAAIINRIPNAKLRELGHLLLKDAIGNSKEWAQGWTTGELKKQLVRQHAGRFHVTLREAYGDLAKAKGWNFFEKYRQHQDFHQRITRLKRGDLDAYTGDKDYDAALDKGVVAAHKLYATMAEEAKKAGVKGADGFDVNPTYVNRVWRHMAIAETSNRLGEAAVTKLIMRAIRVPGMAVGDKRAAAEGFLSAVRKLQFKADMVDVILRGRDMNTLRSELDNLGLNDKEINSLVNLMFEAHGGDPDAGKPGNLRHRFQLDETEFIKVKGETLRLSDLLENDSRVLADLYMSSMAGRVAAAKKGFDSDAAFSREIAAAKDLWLQEHPNEDPAAFNRSVVILEDAWANLVGRPMSTFEFNRINRFMTAQRAWTRSSTLGQLGISAAFEMWNTLALGTAKAFFQQMPTFRKLLGAMRRGYIPDTELAQDLMHMGGWGTEMSSSYARQHEVTEFTYDRGLTRFEDWGNKASHAVDIMSGNASFTSATRMLTAMTMAQKHFNFATGRAKITEAIKDRLVHQGINRGDIDRVLADLKRFSKANSRGTLEEIDWEGWQQQAMDTYDAYTLMSQREVRDAIQDHDIGETMPWMHTTVGKIAAELRVFNLVAHAKQFLKSVGYHDRTSAMQWSLGFAGQALAYMVQTSINFGHNREELDKRLTLERIAKAAVSRMSALGMLSYGVDTAGVILGGEAVLQGGTANTQNRNLFVTPSMMQMQRIYNAVKTTTNAVNPFADTVTTRTEMQDSLKWLPGANLWGIRNLSDYIASGFPKSEPRPSAP